MAQADTVKVLLLGDGAVGKSTLVGRWLENRFHPSFTVTIGVASAQKVLVRHGKTLKVLVWDAAGKKEFRTISPAYYAKAQGILIVYDITNRASFEQVKYWWEQVQEHGDPRTPLVILGNKVDLVDENMSSLRIPKSEEDELASELGVRIMSVSAKTGEGVEEAFLSLLAWVCPQRNSFFREVSSKSLRLRPRVCSCFGKGQSDLKHGLATDKAAANASATSSLDVLPTVAPQMNPAADTDANGVQVERGGVLPGAAETQETKPKKEMVPLVPPTCAVMASTEPGASTPRMIIEDDGSPIEMSQVQIANSLDSHSGRNAVSGREMATPSRWPEMSKFCLCSGSLCS